MSQDTPESDETAPPRPMLMPAYPIPYSAAPTGTYSGYPEQIGMHAGSPTTLPPRVMGPLSTVFRAVPYARHFSQRNGNEVGVRPVFSVYPVKDPNTSLSTNYLWREPFFYAPPTALSHVGSPPLKNETQKDPHDSHPPPGMVETLARIRELWNISHALSPLKPVTLVVTDVLSQAATEMGEERDRTTATKQEVDQMHPHPVVLAHPSEFTNPSSFLKVYGDPLAYFKENDELPKNGKNGNWACSVCYNVNFPRRFRCNKCDTKRDAEADAIVWSYVKRIHLDYKRHFEQRGTQPLHKIGEKVEQPSVEEDAG